MGWANDANREAHTDTPCKSWVGWCLTAGTLPMIDGCSGWSSVRVHPWSSHSHREYEDSIMAHSVIPLSIIIGKMEICKKNISNMNWEELLSIAVLIQGFDWGLLHDRGMNSWSTLVLRGRQPAVPRQAANCCDRRRSGAWQLVIGCSKQ